MQVEPEVLSGGQVDNTWTYSNRTGLLIKTWAAEYHDRHWDKDEKRWRTVLWNTRTVEPTTDFNGKQFYKEVLEWSYTD